MKHDLTIPERVMFLAIARKDINLIELMANYGFSPHSLILSPEER